VSDGPASLLVVAGEASADLHGSRVLEALRERIPGLAAFGLGGERLRAAGLTPVADPRALSVVGISEALRALPRIRRVFRAVRQAVERERPAAALLMDLPDFNLRLARSLSRRNIPVVYYIAPQAWAWRKGRVRQLRRRVRRLCVIFPFEQAFFEAHGVPVEFVGHPLTEVPLPSRAADPDRLALVPGSRRREIERLLPAIAGAAALLKRERPGLRFELPLAPGADETWVRGALARAGVEASLVQGGASAALAGARLGLVASGTATLEGALLGVPMVVVYRVSRLTYLLVRPLYRLPHVCIVNILAGRGVVPELLQGKVTAEAIAAAARPLLADGGPREAMIGGLREVREALGTGRSSGRPSRRVAEVLAEFLARDGGGSVAG